MNTSRLRWCAVSPQVHIGNGHYPDVGAWSASAEPDTLIRLIVETTDDEDTADAPGSSSSPRPARHEVSDTHWNVSHTFPTQMSHAGDIAVNWPAVVVIELRARDSIGLILLGAVLGEARAPSEGGPVVVVFGDGWAALHHAADAAQLPYSLDGVIAANDLAQAVALGVYEFDRVQRAPARPSAARVLLLSPKTPT